MVTHAVRWRASTGIVAVAAWTGCLDRNPEFEEPLLPTASGSGSTTTTGDPTVDPTSQGTTGSPTAVSGSESATDPTDGLTTGMTTGMTTTDGLTTGITTMPPAGCGDAILTPDEECDDGPMNADTAACTSTCKLAKCGDGLIQTGVEYCEDLNDDPADGCVKCFEPHVCQEVLDRAPGVPTGLYKMDPDGPGPGTLVPVYCDMTLKGGGWTRVERSPFGDAIARALFEDVEVNYDDPTNSRYRMGKAAMVVVEQHSNEMWIECGGVDHLWTDSDFLFAGEDNPNSCANYGKVLYKEAQLNDIVLTDVELCTGFTGFLDGECPGAWRIDEQEQELCALSSTPWIDGQMFTTLYSDIFAADPSTAEPELHDCHKPGAIRAVFLR
ncbi:fibrinogen-like YCDxxxxGGGW domain-containing protein [Nannocystis pusilla]|uniref:fibrinogen-like YCDxxxxGGGW domain-containing protein n=1 Tax=Nannocystis pusilla TaxID=889268 RepID=UPI003B78132E